MRLKTSDLINDVLEMNSITNIVNSTILIKVITITNSLDVSFVLNGINLKI